MNSVTLSYSAENNTATLNMPEWVITATVNDDGDVELRQTEKKRVSVCILCSTIFTVEMVGALEFVFE